MPDTDYPDSEQERLEAEAVTWMVRLTSGETTESDRRTAESWRRQSPAHQRAFEKVCRLWDGMDPLHDTLATPTWNDPPLPQGNGQLAATSSVFTNQTWWFRGTIAATIAALALTFMLQTNMLIKWKADYYTETGQQSIWELEDGSIVQLNTQAAVTIDYSGNTRRVILLQGEAAFQVAQDVARPFLVQSQGGIVRAVGTEFLVKNTDQHVVVTVVEGVVDVTDEQHLNGTHTLTRLTAGQRIRYGSESGIGPVETVDLHVATAWQRGRLIFESAPLTDVIKEINRYRPGHIAILNDSLRHHKVNGVFDLNSLNSAVATMEQTLPMTSLHLSDRFIFLQ